jgi:hypothetical protein
VIARDVPVPGARLLGDQERGGLDAAEQPVTAGHTGRRREGTHVLATGHRPRIDDEIGAQRRAVPTWCA